MDSALVLLLRLRLYGWLRRARRSLSSVRGVLLAVFGALLFASWLLPAFLLSEPPTAGYLAEVRRYGPLAILAFFLTNLIFSSGERAITFTPAEVNFLFPGPFTRRQLLLYKVLGSVAAAVFSGVLMSLLFRRHAGGWLQGMVGLVLALLMLQLFSMAMALLGSIIGARAFNRRRRLVLVALVVLVAAGPFWQGAALLEGGPAAAADAVLDSPVMHALLTPFRWVILTLTAERVWPDMLQWAGLSVLVNLALLWVVLALDAQYLESAAASSEKIYAQLEKRRRGGMAAVGLGSGKARFGVPSLPWWGGVGPVAWRQLVSAARNLWWLFPLVLFSGFLLGPVFLGIARDVDAREIVPALVVPMLVFMGLFAPTMMAFDFRSDLDRMEVLKSLPLPAWRIAAGQVLTPVLLLTVLQAAVVGTVLAGLGGEGLLFLAVLPFLPPLNFLLFGIENIFFLWYPTRQLGGGPGDFHLLGRHMLLWLGKLLTLLLLLLLAGAAAAAVYLLTGGSWVAAGVVAWCLVAAAAAGVVPLLALAFGNFDVSKDIP